LWYVIVLVHGRHVTACFWFCPRRSCKDGEGKI